MKTYRRHNCTSQHRTYKAFVKCFWPKANIIVRQDGPWASVSFCAQNRHGYQWAFGTVMLFATEGQAQYAKNLIDNGTCCGVCSGNHHLVYLEK